jgi:hypothetical protein
LLCYPGGILDGEKTMSDSAYPSLTQHAMLVAWGQYAQCLGLIAGLEAVSLRQKTIKHRPQTKVIEFLVAILGGLPHLKDLSHAAHPLVQDQEVAKAWKQPAWADHSGVSRTLSGLARDEVGPIVEVLDVLSRPIIDREVVLAWRDRDEIVLDCDLTGRPVSNSSTTYPDVAFGHMGDGVHLGYQAAMVSFHSPTYGRIWLSVTPHPGDTVACTLAEELVLATETKLGRSPWRRTDLLQQRLDALARQRSCLAQRVRRARQALKETQARCQETRDQIEQWQDQVQAYEAQYEAQGRPERPHSRLAQARRKLLVRQDRVPRQEQALARAERRWDRCLAKLAACQAEIRQVRARLERFERENAANPAPLRIVLRLDAGFGTPDNVALLVEMGYQVYSKPYGRWDLTKELKKRVDEQTEWTRVGKNAEMVAWPACAVKRVPYPLDLALERFHTGQTLRHSVLLHFGEDLVTDSLPAWFDRYNGRQTIEAGIKQGKLVFQMHHLKVRSKEALYLQEQFAVFAANFVRWAAHWLATQCPQLPDGWQEPEKIPVKEQVQVAAHTSAWVTWQEQGCLLTFTDHSVFAGRSLQINREWAYQRVLPFTKSCVFSTIRAP